MSSLKYSIVALTLGMLVTPFAQAQDQSEQRGEGRRGGKGAPGGAAQGRGQMMNPEARVEQLDRAVSLTADQKKQVTAIYTKQQEDMRNLMSEGRGDPQASRAKMMEMMQATRDQVRALLTDEQKKKFDALPQPGEGRGRGQEERKGEGRGKKQ